MSCEIVVGCCAVHSCQHASVMEAVLLPLHTSISAVEPDWCAVCVCVCVCACHTKSCHVVCRVV